MPFNEKTVLVVGAGASSEVGLPTGAELKDKIARDLDFKTAEFGRKLVFGDKQLYGTLHQYVKSLDNQANDITPYVHAARHIARAMPLSNSIDGFLDSHQGNKEIEFCGKLAIAQSVLRAERHSTLFSNHPGKGQIEFSSLENTWYTRFMRLLADECTKEKLRERLNNISFVIFNYDRCVEHFLYHALQIYFGITGEEAVQYMDNLKLFHPYGYVGNLPWRVSAGTPFGGDDYRNDLLSISKQIKTFTERIIEKTTLGQIKNSVNEANSVIFLGFHFQKQNMNLLKPNELRKAKRVFATVLNRSDSDRQIIEDQIQNSILRQKKSSNIFTVNAPCHDLFDEFWGTLAMT